MMGNDISNQSTYRMWVLEDVVLERRTSLVTNPQPKRRWWRRTAPETFVESVVVNRAAVTILWRYMQKMQETGLRMELLHIGDSVEDLLDLLDKESSSPFTGVVDFPSLQDVVDAMPMRPDVIGVVSEGRDFMRFGSRGVSLVELGN